MNTNHLTTDQLALYVMGGLEPEEGIAISKHAGACPRCAAALQREAELELRLYDVAQTFEAPDVANPPQPSSAGGGKVVALFRSKPLLAALAIAAALLLVVIAVPRSTGGPLPAYTVDLSNPARTVRGAGDPAAAEVLELGTTARLVARPASAPGVPVAASVRIGAGVPLVEVRVSVADSGSVLVELPTGPGTALPNVGAYDLTVAVAPANVGDPSTSLPRTEARFLLTLVDKPSP
jgi:anti-sigma factor RsiW